MKVDRKLCGGGLVEDFLGDNPFEIVMGEWVDIEKDVNVPGRSLTTWFSKIVGNFDFLSIMKFWKYTCREELESKTTLKTSWWLCFKTENLPFSKQWIEKRRNLKFEIRMQL